MTATPPRSFGWTADKGLKSFWQHDPQLPDLDCNLLGRIGAACTALGRPLPRCGLPDARRHMDGVDRAMAQFRESCARNNRHALEHPADDDRACLGHRPDSASASPNVLFSRWFNANGARLHGIDPEATTAREAWECMQSGPTSLRAPRWCTSYWEEVSRHASSGALSAATMRRTQGGLSVSTIDLFRRATGTSIGARSQRLYAEIMSGLERSGTWQFAKKWAQSGAPQRVVDVDRVGPFLRDVCTLLGDTIERDRADAYRHGPDCARLFGASIADAAPAALQCREVVEALVGNACDAAQSNALVPIVAAKQASAPVCGRDTVPPCLEPDLRLAVGATTGAHREDRHLDAALAPDGPTLEAERDDNRRFCFLLSEDDPLDEKEQDTDNNEQEGRDIGAVDSSSQLDCQPPAAASARRHRQPGTAPEEREGAAPLPLAKHSRPDMLHASDWSIDEVGDWVATCDDGRLAEYREVFVENCIIGRDLQYMADRSLDDRIGMLKCMGITRLGHALDFCRLMEDLFAPCRRPLPSEPEAPLVGSPPSSSTSLSAIGDAKRRSEVPTRPDAKKPRVADKRHLPRASAAVETGNGAKKTPSKCARCHVPPVPGHTLCERHRLDQNARQRQYDRKRAKTKRQRTRGCNERQMRGDLDGTAGIADGRNGQDSDRAYSDTSGEQPQRVARRRRGPHRTPNGTGTVTGIAHYYTAPSASTVPSRDSGSGYGYRHAASMQEGSDDVALSDGQKMHVDRQPPTIAVASVNKEASVSPTANVRAMDSATPEGRDDAEDAKQRGPTKRKWADQETADGEGTETEDEEPTNGQSGLASPIEVDYPPVTPRDLLALWPERRYAVWDHAAKEDDADDDDDDTKEDDNAESDWYVQRVVQA